MPKKDALNWFEIQVADFDRAKRFYDSILQTTLTDVASPTCRMGIFPYEANGGIGGSIAHRPEAKPGASGTVVYLNVEGDLEGVLGRIPASGGKVVQPKLAIGEHGFIGIFQDTEGNVVGLHSLR